ncbi:hypothetical protein [Methylorubrum extorquens]|uniref:hypothetical protein n=1 Tax=Methylorubrum extorquens TaxID=408 RepID=UPI00209E083A|nr:hypothetical protein [Methylorubrum extorquens]MCP1536561.1 ABC-type phosphate transport system substrate-binding protein [Methylorubrum extorquens]
MQGLVSMIAASAVLSAGLVAGLAATDAAAGPKPALSAAPLQAPAAMAPKVTAPKTSALTGGTSTTAPCAAAWPYQPAACAADGRKVRIIALTAR